MLKLQHTSEPVRLSIEQDVANPFPAQDGEKPHEAAIVLTYGGQRLVLVGTLQQVADAVSALDMDLTEGRKTAKIKT